MLVYSANNLPYASLSGVLTGDMKQRNSISSYRFTAVTLAQFIVQVILLPLVLILPPAEQKTSVKQDLADLFKNKPWIIMLTVTVFIFITLSLKGGMASVCLTPQESF